MDLPLTPKLFLTTESISVHHIYQAFLWPVSHGARPALCLRLSGAYHKQDVPVSVLISHTGLCSNQDEEKTSSSKNRVHHSYLQAGFGAMQGHWGATASGWAGSRISLLESWSNTKFRQPSSPTEQHYPVFVLWIYATIDPTGSA